MTGDIETVKAAIAAALLSADFATALAAVDTEKNDGSTTPGPAFGYPYERAVLEGYPAFELQGLQTTYNSNGDVKEATHQIGVVWTLAGDNEAVLTQVLERLVRATRDFLWRSTLSGQIGLAPMLVKSENYSALQPGTNTPLLKGCVVIIEATTFA